MIFLNFFFKLHIVGKYNELTWENFTVYCVIGYIMTRLVWTVFYLLSMGSAAEKAVSEENSTCTRQTGNAFILGSSTRITTWVFCWILIYCFHQCPPLEYTVLFFHSSFPPQRFVLFWERALVFFFRRPITRLLHARKINKASPLCCLLHPWLCPVPIPNRDSNLYKTTCEPFGQTDIDHRTHIIALQLQNIIFCIYFIT